MKYAIFATSRARRHRPQLHRGQALRHRESRTGRMSIRSIPDRTRQVAAVTE